MAELKLVPHAMNIRRRQRLISLQKISRHHPKADIRNVVHKAAENDAVGVVVDTATHGVDNALRLLEDLLEHKVRKLALHDLLHLHLKCLQGYSKARDGKKEEKKRGQYNKGLRRT